MDKLPTTMSGRAYYNVLDEDTFVSDSDIGVPTQQSVKAYVDNKTSRDIILTDTVWDDLRVPTVSTKLGGSKDPGFDKVLDNGAGSQGVFSYLFSPTAEEELYFMVQMPHSWKYGTSLHPHVHWVPVSNGSAGQVVAWGMEYSVAAIGSTFGATTIISGNAHTPAETLVAKRHYLTSLTEISMSGIDTVSAMLVCRVFRDATGALKTDDYAADAALLEIDFHYQINSLGSDTEYA